jgi:hypothetical protein
LGHGFTRFLYRSQGLNFAPFQVDDLVLPSKTSF